MKRKMRWAIQTAITNEKKETIHEYTFIENPDGQEIPSGGKLVKVAYYK